MNNVTLIGRLTRDPEIRYTQGNQTAVCTFALAIDRPVKPGAEKQTDYPRIMCFGKTAENCDKYLSKGKLCGVQGRIQTGKYEKNGQMVYTTDVVADRVEFLERGEKNDSAANNKATRQSEPAPQGFSELDEDVPF